MGLIKWVVVVLTELFNK